MHWLEAMVDGESGRVSVMHGAGALNANDQFCGSMNGDANLNEFMENVWWVFFRSA
jgi:hypothetical protein